MSRKRLGYKTRHVMLNLKDEWYEKMKGEGINMSALVNRFLDEYFNLEVCPHCLIGEVLNRNCAKCEAPAIICDNSSCSRAGEVVNRGCPLAPALRKEGVRLHLFGVLRMKSKK